MRTRTISEKAEKVSQTVNNRSVVPFTGGLLFVIYAFFWPVEYGQWLGTIVRAFRGASGI